MSTVPPVLRTEGEHTASQSGPKYIVCDNCKCSLTVPYNQEPGGQVFKMSPEATELRDYRETTQKNLTRKDEEITALNAKIVDLQSEIRKLSPAEPTKKKFAFF